MKWSRTATLIQGSQLWNCYELGKCFSRCTFLVVLNKREKKVKLATLSEGVKPAGVTFVRTSGTASYCDQSNLSFWCWLFFLRTFITIFPTSQITSSSLLWKLCLPLRNYLIKLLRERHLLSLVGFGVKHKWKITDHNVSAMFISTCIYLALFQW